ncbi:MAG: NUDIX domain-containing protein [Geminicoccaceae bacterium]|nr:NUDIX domain-containing protein [Geminicoccaceae bacterium]
MTRRRFSRDDVEIVQSRRLFDGFFAFDRLHLRHRRFGGGWTRPLERLLLRIPKAVVVLPYDPMTDRVVLIEQFRSGALDHPGGPWLVEAVAGLKDRDEDDETTARREVMEEAGLHVEALVPCGAYVPSPGAVTERAVCFCARVDAARAGGVHGLEGEGEDIRSLVMPADEAFTLVESGEIVAVNAIVTLRWLERHREELRERWRV